MKKTQPERQKIVDQTEMLSFQLTMEYLFQKNGPTGDTRAKRIMEIKQNEQRIEQLKKRLLEAMDGDVDGFNEELKKIERKVEEITGINYNPPNPYKGILSPTKKNVQNMQADQSGPPFCEKCQHFHWPQEPCSDWQD